MSTKHIEFSIQWQRQWKILFKKRTCKKKKIQNCSCVDTSAASTRCHNETPTMTLNISRGLAVSVEQSPTRQRRRQQTKGATVCCRGCEWGKNEFLFSLIIFTARRRIKTTRLACNTSIKSRVGSVE